MTQYRELFQSGNYIECENACRDQLTTDQLDQDVWVMLCLSLIGQERWQEAIDLHVQALNILKLPSHRQSVFHQLAGDAASGAGSAEEAISYYKMASDLAPGRAVAHYALARAYFENNDFELCEAALHRLFVIGPSIDDRIYAKALYMYSRLPGDNTAAGFFERYSTLKPRVDDPVFFYGMGNLLVRDAQYELAFRFFSTANTLKRKLEPYDFTKDLQVVEEQLKNSSEIDLATDHGLCDVVPIPVFIVGMPRTGSSILEQMLGAHSMVQPFGESGLLLDAIRKEVDVSYEPQGTRLLMEKIRDKGFCQRVRDNFLESLGDSNVKVIIDKSLANFHFIPLIRLAFPNALIVHTSREKEPCIWSSFRTHFTRGVRYSESLSEISKYYDELVSLMDRWTNQLPEMLTEVKYETMIQDPEKQIRDLLQRLKLEFEAACLEPSQQDRIVETASQIQVTQPLYKQANMDFEPFRELVAAQF